MIRLRLLPLAPGLVDAGAADLPRRRLDVAAVLGPGLFAAVLLLWLAVALALGAVRLLLRRFGLFLLLLLGLAPPLLLRILVALLLPVVQRPVAVGRRAQGEEDGQRQQQAGRQPAADEDQPPGPAAAAELAKRTGLDPGYVARWCDAACAFGYIDEADNSSPSVNPWI